MLKNEKLIHRLELKEKLELIVSFNELKTAEVENYNFPVFDLVSDPVSENRKNRCTNFPTLKGLSLTFNDELISEVSSCAQIEKNVFSENPFIYLENNTDINNISDDTYLNGRVLSAYFKSIKNSHSSGLYKRSIKAKEKSVSEEINALTDFYVLKDDYADYIIVESLEEMEELKHFYNPTPNFFGKTNNKNELVRFINGSIPQNFFVGDKEECLQFLVKCKERHDYYYGRYKNGFISESEYRLELEKGTLLSIDKINECADRYISMLLEIEKDRKESIAENSFTTDSSTYSFNASSDFESAYKAAKEGVVLVKNNKNVLPIKLNKKIAIVGDAFKNNNYYLEEFGHDSILFKTPYELISDYLELDCVGYAHGYLKDEAINKDMIENAKELINKADVMLYYMTSDERTGGIPAEQIEVLNILKAYKNIKTVVVLNTKFYCDIPFVDLVDGLILSIGLGEAGPRAVLDIVGGTVNPSGKLSSSYPVLNSDDDLNDILPAYTNKDYPIRFPFGYGLSYSKFVYSNLVIKENSLTFSILNDSDKDGYATTFLFVKKDSSKHVLRNKSLRGYTKNLIKAHETERIEIPFDSMTFAYYDTKNHAFGTEEGTYKIFIGTDYSNTVLKGTINLAKVINRGFDYSSSTILDSIYKKNQFTELEGKVKELHIPRKRILSILVLIYSILFGYVLYGEITKFNLGVIVNALALLVLPVITLVWFIIFNVKTTKKYKKFMIEYENSEITLLDMVDNVKDFDEVSRTVVKKEETVYDLSNVKLEKNEVETPFEKQVVEIVKEEIKKEKPVLEEVKSEEAQEEQFEEVDLEVEKEVEVIEEVTDINEANLSLEEIEAIEAELESGVAGIEVSDFEEYEEVITYNNNQSISQVADNLISYALSKGIVLELSTARSIIASIASSNIVFIHSKVKELLPRLSRIITEFFSSKGHEFKEEPNFISPFFLSWKKDLNGEYQKTEFVNDIYTASKFKEALNITTLSNVTMKNFPLYFKDFIDFSSSPTHDHYLKLNNKQSLKIPTNITFLVIPKEDNFMSLMDKRVRKLSSIVSCVVREAIPEEIKEMEVPDPISYDYFKEIIGEAKKDFYLSEEMWKKIDALEEDINQTDRFAIDNKLMLSLENYLSIYMDLGGDEVDALDSMLTSRIFPIVKGFSFAKGVESTKNLNQMFEKCIGDDYISKLKRTIKDYEDLSVVKIKEEVPTIEESVLEEANADKETIVEKEEENDESNSEEAN